MTTAKFGLKENGHYGPVVLLTGTANVPLANLVAAHLGLKCQVVTMEFSNGETGACITESIRDSDVYIIQSTASVNCNASNMELFIMLQAAKLASPGRVTAVVPCLSYARQDRKSKPREPITAKLIADIICLAGANRVLSVDLHADQIQGFFTVPVDHLSAENYFVRYILQMAKESKEEQKKIVIVSPDAGGVKRVRNVTNKLAALGLVTDLAIIHKERPRANEINEDTMKLVGDVRGCTAILVDDIVDTGGTLLKAAKMIKTVGGAVRVVAMATHGVLSGKAFQNLLTTPNNCLSELVVTNTLDIEKAMKARNIMLKKDAGQEFTKFTVIDISDSIAEAVRRSHSGDSLSELFDLEKFLHISDKTVVVTV